VAQPAKKTEAQIGKKFVRAIFSQGVQVHMEGIVPGCPIPTG
jgi:hypothetical protein